MFSPFCRGTTGASGSSFLGGGGGSLSPAGVMPPAAGPVAVFTQAGDNNAKPAIRLSADRDRETDNTAGPEQIPERAICMKKYPRKEKPGAGRAAAGTLTRRDGWFQRLSARMPKELGGRVTAAHLEGSKPAPHERH